jgi:hypothetical protein
MVESCVVILFLCLLFLGLFQFAQAHVAREVLNYCASRAARAKTVGFNRWMVEKTLRVSAIPNSGRLLVPDVPGGDPVLENALATLGPGAFWDFAMRSTPRSPTIDAELARIPEYMASANGPRAGNLLDYEYWADDSPNRLNWRIDTGAGDLFDPSAGSLVSVSVSQNHDLLVALGPLNEGILEDIPGERIPLRGRYAIENHYSLYLDGSFNW